MLFKKVLAMSFRVEVAGFNRVASKSNVGELGSSTYTNLFSCSYKRNLATVEIPVSVDT